MRKPVEFTHDEERSSAATINRQWRADMQDAEKAIEQAIVEVNSYKPPQSREVLADHPVVQMGEAAAKSVEATADAVVEEALALKKACSDFASDLRKGAQEIADRATFILKKIHTAGKELQTARENFLNGNLLPGDGDTSQLPPGRGRRQQPGATPQPNSDGS